MEKNPNLFFEKNYSSFINSFKKIGFNTAYMAFYDALFYSISSLFVYLGFKYIEKKASAFNLPENIMELSLQEAGSLAANLRGFFFLIIFLAVFLVLLTILNWSLFKGLNWSLAAKRKFDFKFFKRFLLLNLAWLPIWILLLLFVFIGINPDAILYFVMAVLAIAAYFSNILYALFAKESNFKSVKMAFKIAFAKMHFFVIPYVIAVFLPYILLKLLIQNLQQTAFLIISALAFIIISAWFRLYIVEVVDSVE